MGTKICKKCLIEKSVDDFNKDKYSLDGLRYRCRECTKLEYRNFYYKNQEGEIKRQREYQENNLENVKKTRRIYHGKRYRNDILYRLKFNVRNRIKLFLKSKNFNQIKNGTFKIVGCTPQELKDHIEKQFFNGMNWENYSHDGWHIDHKIPLDSAKNEEEVLRLSHYTNLQPMWSDENYKKGTKIL